MSETKTTVPPGPWTVEKLGEELYCQLARDYGVFDPSRELATYRPPLDLTTFYQPAEEAEEED